VNRKRLIRAVGLLVAALFALTLSTTNAQTAAQVAAILNQNGRLALVTIDQNGSLNTLRQVESYSAILSPLANSYAQVLYNQADVLLEYGYINGETQRLTISSPENLITQPVFDKQGNTLLFTTATFEGDWKLYFVSLNGEVRWLAGKFTFEQGKEDASTSYGILLPLSDWDAASSSLLTFRVMPFTESFFLGLFSIDLTAAAPSTNGTPLSMSAVTPRGALGASLFALPSPDQNFAVEVVVDPENPSEGYPTDVPYYFPLSGLILHDLNSANSQKLTVPQGQGIGASVWAEGSQAFYFTVGYYRQTTSPVAPTLYAHTLGGATNAVAALSTSDAEAVSGLAVCGERVYYVLTGAAELQPPDKLNTFTVGSASIQTILDSEHSIALLGCVHQ
jgi:hypothetical protein